MEGGPERAEALRRAGVDILGFLERGHLVGTLVTLDDGRVMPAEDFMVVCGDHVTIAIRGLKQFDVGSPDYTRAFTGMQAMIDNFVGVEQPNQ